MSITGNKDSWKDCYRGYEEEGSEKKKAKPEAIIAAEIAAAEEKKAAKLAKSEADVAAAEEKKTAIIAAKEKKRQNW